MKTLYLIRHAKSSWKNPNLSDFDRPLNDRGKRAVVDMGNRLKEKAVLPNLILSSSAKRTKKTAQKIAKSIGYSPKNIVYKDELYLCSIHEMLQAVNQLPHNANTVFVVGHNPTMSNFCDYLTGFSHPFPTCCIAKINFDIDNWEMVSHHLGELNWIDFPKNK